MAESPIHDENSIESNHSIQKFKLVICEIFNPRLHGFNNDSDPHVQGHYLVNGKYDYILPSSLLAGYDSDGEYWGEEWFVDQDIYEMIECCRLHYTFISETPQYNKHPFIRNYRSIITRENYIQPEIAQCIYLSGDECVAILKTFWLRIVQRTWKRIYASRKNKIALRKSIHSLKYRETHGGWPTSCRHLDGLRGMLVKKMDC